LKPSVEAINEPKREKCGAPDYNVSLRTPAGPLTIGYIEAKDIGIPLLDTERGEQMLRYLPALDNLILTDYLEFRWYVGGTLRATERLATPTAKKTLLSVPDGETTVAHLLTDFLSHKTEPIKSPRDLAERMARLTYMIRDIIVRAFEAKEESNLLRDARDGFSDVLIPSLSVSEFADMFAQTLAYGLFAARINHKGATPFQRRDAAYEIPKTNPFLRAFFDRITGPDLDDEPFVGFVDDLAHVLAETDMATVLADFGKSTRRDDPIVHFYETFLAAYDPKLREMRGVYYTPAPVVSYIVRSVDHVLKAHFGCAQGLADTSTVTYEQTDDNGNRQARQTPRVLMLDPATGTATFLYAVVDHIRALFMRQDNAGLWSGYVRDQLLPRLFGFELLMAPYTVAHLKLGFQLAALDLPEDKRHDWAYDFKGNARLGVYLTNSLEEAVRSSQALLGGYISREANAAAEIKRERPIMVVFGNPPYSGISSNKGAWIDGLLKGRLPDGSKVPSYYEADGKALGERKLWLQDDYVKFIRFGRWRIEQTGSGVLAFITNHSYLDNPTFRGMRQQLIQAFTDIYILDLHGNAKKRQHVPNGGADQNVFDIQQGVAIAIFVKEPGKEAPATVHHADLWGTREGKYTWLEGNSAVTTTWTVLEPTSPFYFFVPRDTTFRSEYERARRVTDILDVNTSGIVTARDGFVTDVSEKDLLQRVGELRSEVLSDDAIRAKYFPGKGAPKYAPGDSRSWKLPEARRKVRADAQWEERVEPCLYRPFDVRSLYYVPWMVDWPRSEVMGHMLAGRNLGLVTTRSVEIGRGYEHVFCTNTLIQHHTVSIKEVNYLFPLYLYPSINAQKAVQQSLLVEERHTGPDGRRHNLNLDLVADLEGRLALSFVPDGTGDLFTTFGPEDVFHYVYAILYSPTYRSRYADSLRSDFPRIPFTSDVDLFRILADKGGQLVALHLLESPVLDTPMTRYPVPGDNIVAAKYPRYVPLETDEDEGRPLEAGRVYISGDSKNGAKGQYFEGVPCDAWKFSIGGTQVCEKWLKDRREHVLSHEDLVHYGRMVTAVAETIRLMDEIDDAIPDWPIV